MKIYGWTFFTKKKRMRRRGLSVLCLVFVCIFSYIDQQMRSPIRDKGSKVCTYASNGGGILMLT